MYQNLLAAELLQSQRSVETISILMWYDMFTLRGFDNWFWDAIVLAYAPWWKFIEAIIRLSRGDWEYWTSEASNDIDMNRLWPKREELNVQDEVYLENRSQGTDCNGNVGQGLYCYCPSQGYNC